MLGSSFSSSRWVGCIDGVWGQGVCAIRCGGVCRGCGGVWVCVCGGVGVCVCVCVKGVGYFNLFFKTHVKTRWVQKTMDFIKRIHLLHFTSVEVRDSR